MAITNDLYLAVLPLVHLTPNQFFGYGLTEETVTLFPDRNFATHFFPDEVDAYIEAFKSRTQWQVGGHSKGYEFFKERTPEGRVIPGLSNMSAKKKDDVAEAVKNKDQGEDAAEAGSGQKAEDRTTRGGERAVEGLPCKGRRS